MVGQIGQVATGGMLAYGYRLLFQALSVRRTWATGAFVGVAHGLVSGTALAFAPLVHPQIPGSISPPGMLMRREGWRQGATFVLLHVLFGAVVGLLIDAGASESGDATARQRR